MRAGNPDDMTTMQNLLADPRGPGSKSRAALQHCLKQRIASRYDVADDKQVGVQCELGSIVALDELHAGRAQLFAHRRIDGRITTCDPMSCRQSQLRHAPHERAADSHNMQVHDVSRQTFKAGDSKRRRGPLSAASRRGASCWQTRLATR